MLSVLFDTAAAECAGAVVPRRVLWLAPLGLGEATISRQARGGGTEAGQDTRCAEQAVAIILFTELGQMIDVM